MDFEDFLTHWRSTKNCSDQTIRSYRNDLTHFDAFLRERGIRRLTQVNHKIINDYIADMKQRAVPRFGRTGLADSSIARRLAAVSSYFEYVRTTSNPKLRNPLRELTRRWRKNDEPKPVDEMTLENLIAGITVQRDRVLMSLFLATGLRVSEMHQLNRDSVTFESTTDATGVEHIGGTGVVIGKGGKKRRFYVDDQTLKSFAEYLATRTDSHPALFLSERKKRMSVRAIQHTLATWCRRLGLPHVNVHRLRHSFATAMANANISSMVLKDLMGHSTLSTTQRYFKLTDTTLARGYFSAMEYLRGNG